MDRMVLDAEPRGINTRGEMNYLRRQDMIPAIVYGRGKETQALIMEGRPLRQVLSTGGSNVLVNLKIKKKGKKAKEETVMFKDIQRDIMLKEKILHVDFIRISMKDKIEVDVALNFIGEAAGAKEGGVLQIARRDITVRCLPAAIPESIEVDVSELNIGDSLTAGSLQLEDGVELLTSPEETLAVVQVPASVEEEVVEEEAAETPEEGEAAETAEEGEAPEE